MIFVTRAFRPGVLLLSALLASACGDSGPTSGTGEQTDGATTESDATDAMTDATEGGSATTAGASESTTEGASGSTSESATEGTTEGTTTSDDAVLCAEDAINFGELCFIPSTVGLGMSPASIDAVDLDLDGHLDIFAANLSVNPQRVLFGDGAGQFSEIEGYPIAPVGQRDVTAGDINGDGLPELIGANLIVGYVTVHPNLGARQFDAFTPVAAGVKPRRVELADLNSDGALDLLAVSEDPGPEAAEGLIIRLGDGEGGFAEQSVYAVGPGPYDLAYGDVDGDGALDVVVTNYDSESDYSDVVVRYGDGQGDLTDQSRVFEIAEGSRRVLLADYDDDGALDILTASYNQSAVGFLPGDGDGDFAVASDGEWIPLQLEDITGVYDIAVRDLNDDGRSDLISVHRESGAVAVVLRGEDSLAGPRYNYVTGLFPLTLTVGDFNSDARPDIAVASSFSGALSLLLSDDPIG